MVGTSISSALLVPGPFLSCSAARATQNSRSCLLEHGPGVPRSSWCEHTELSSVNRMMNMKTESYH